MTETIEDPALYLAGPTGCGKSRVAVALANRIGEAEIVNADAFQVYQRLEILAASPAESERGKVPHHLYGILNADEASDAASFSTRAREVIDQISGRGVLPIVVGGSGLYLKALTHGLADTPPADPALRSLFDSLESDELVAWLQLVDPEGAAKSNLKNRRYVGRNLEITLLKGRPASEVKREFSRNEANIRAVFLTRERGDLYGRIDRRTEEMFEEGVVDEVRRLDSRNLSATTEKAIGLREIRALISGEINEADCLAAIQQATRRYAKRQMTWFRREKAFQTVCIGKDETAESAANRILNLYPDLIHV